MNTRRIATAGAAIALSATAIAFAANDFISTWKSSKTGPLNYAGRKVAALVIVDDDSLRMSSEEALAREITARGPVGVAAYRLIPREELVDKDRARPWFEKATVEAVVAMRIVSVDKEKVYSAMVWSSGYYGNFWDYYGTAWSSPYPIGKARTETTLTIETILYDVPRAAPIWAGVSRTTNPKDVASFMKQLARDVTNELRKEGLAKKP